MYKYCLTEKLIEKSEWSLLHPLFLFHILFYFLINIWYDGKKQLRDSGGLNLIVKELRMIQLIPKWHQVSKKYLNLFLVGIGNWKLQYIV